jgi:iron(III) transport system ATP-binding protein
VLSVRNLVKSYPGRAGGTAARAVDGVSFEVGKGEFFTLLGPSGCGKTTTLQCVAGLETPSSGTIELGGATVFCSDRNQLVPANRRNLGMVFQSYAIWPHLSVFDNVAFPVVHGTRTSNTRTVKKRVMDALALVKLQDFHDRPAPHLSGGQQQRVALARALVNEPSLLLLDEPLSNLDAKLRDAMRVEIRQLVKSLGITTIFVTHDQLEAMAMSDTIVVMQSGRIVQAGAPQDVYLRPTSAFTADFMGRSNIIPGARAVGMDVVVTGFGDVSLSASANGATGAVAIVVRPHVIVASRDQPENPANVFACTLIRQSFLGDSIEAEVRAGGENGEIIRVSLDPYQRFTDGERLWLHLPPDRCVVVPRGARP